MNKLVFIVEDDIIQQKMLSKYFETLVGSFKVRTYSNPEEMMAHLNEKPFVVVLDHYFGNISTKTGLDYLSVLRKDHTQIPVIYYTSIEDHTIREKVMSLGAVSYIYKDSASFVRLRTAIDELERKRAERENRGFLKKLFRI